MGERIEVRGIKSAPSPRPSPLKRRERGEVRVSG
jgi:hypothetical protein